MSATRYAKGIQVLFQGLPHQGRFSTQGDQPDGFLADPQSPWTPLYAIPGEPTG